MWNDLTYTVHHDKLEHAILLTYQEGKKHSEKWLPKGRSRIGIFVILADHVEDAEGATAAVGDGDGEADLRRSVMRAGKQAWQDLGGRRL